MDAGLAARISRDAKYRVRKSRHGQNRPCEAPFLFATFSLGEQRKSRLSTKDFKLEGNFFETFLVKERSPYAKKLFILSHIRRKKDFCSTSRVVTTSTEAASRPSGNTTRILPIVSPLVTGAVNSAGKS